MRERRFIHAGRFRSASEFIKWLEADRWVYWNHKPQHPAVIRSMTLNSVLGAVAVGTIHKAKENPKYWEGRELTI